MTKNSVICKFIEENPITWEEKLTKEYQIKVKKENDLAIFNYAIISDFYNPLVQEARGIIINYLNREVVCWPFRKFGNYAEGYADEIDWNSARVLEKVDGSIVKLWFDHQNDRWQFSTNGVIRAENATVDGMEGITYGSVIRQADNYKDIPFDTLDKDYTYVFELVSPITRVVIEYKQTLLYHLGTRSNLSGEEKEVDIGIKKPRSYSLGCLEDCINSAIELNKRGECDSEIDNEGFVVVDKDYHRIKIKSPDYVMMHHVSSLKTINKKECLTVLINDRAKIDLLSATCPDIIPTIKYYDYRLAELLHDADKIALLAKSLYEEYSHDRKAVASVIVKHPLSAIGFKSLSSTESGSEIALKLPLETLCKFIPDYEPYDMSQLFIKGNDKK